VLTLFSIAAFVPMVSTIKCQNSRAIQTQSKECIQMKKSYRHRYINYNHLGSCEPFWFCTCTWTCCTSEAGASQHQPQSPRQLACPAVMWHTWQL